MSRSSAEVRRPIRRLDASTVQRIAAGEVVERPASVVKELVENAVDAGAKTITVRLREGGLGRIEVADDGSGIPAEELELALERHATSKIGPTDALEEIATLGFRGEALASIAAVARLRLVSRTPNSEAANSIAVDGGGPAVRGEGGRSVGTTVEVEGLFFNTPARRKFLRSPVVEQLEVLRAVEHLYLARPAVALHLFAEERELGSYPAVDDLREGAAQVLGPEFLEQSFAVDASLAGSVRVRGVLGRPHLAAGNARRLFLAVNGRTIESRAIAQAVRFAFQEYIPKTRFPLGVIHLDVPPERVDVNVHPTKREVRLARESELVEELRVAVRRALLGAPALARIPDAPFPSSAGGPTRRILSDARPIPRGGTPSGSGRAVIPEHRGAQRRLSEAGPPPTLEERPGRPRLTLFGVLDALYWVGGTATGFVLIDQHAASERLLYEALTADGRLARQTLVEPFAVVLSGSERAALEAHAEDVRAAGFEVEGFGGDRYRVHAVPSYRGHRARPESIRELLDELASGPRPTAPDGMAQRVAASIACHAAIRAGDAIAPEEMARVLDALWERALAVYSCPHGRPILFDLPRGRIDRWFLRSGAGP